VPLEPLPDGTPSALVLAIKNRYFDPADLLIAHGADINALYQLEGNGPSGTILKELLSHHSYASLESINYLFVKPNVNNLVPMGPNLATANSSTIQMRSTPDFIVDQTQNLSALHVLARCALQVINHKSQISARIIERIMEAFNSPEQINQTHPILGTPLCVAAMTENIEMVTALLNARADIAVCARIPDSLTDLQISALALPEQVLQQRQHHQQATVKLEFETFEAGLRGLRRLLDHSTTQDIAPLTELQQLKRIERVIICLQQAAAASASPSNERIAATTERDLTTLQASLHEMEEQLKRDLLMKRMNLGPDDTRMEEANRPVDLSVLSEEKPPGIGGWTVL